MSAGLRFCVELPVGEPGTEPFTSADFMVHVDDEPVWPVEGAAVALYIQVDDVLSHLTEF
ncbi:hypothetical protein [Methylobacterium sp. D54C]